MTTLTDSERRQLRNAIIQLGDHTVARLLQVDRYTAVRHAAALPGQHSTVAAIRAALPMLAQHLANRTNVNCTASDTSQVFPS